MLPSPFHLHNATAFIVRKRLHFLMSTLVHCLHPCQAPNRILLLSLSHSLTCDGGCVSVASRNLSEHDIFVCVHKLGVAQVHSLATACLAVLGPAPAVDSAHICVKDNLEGAKQ